MLKLLTRTIVFAFYEQHAGLFLVICYLLFGAVEGAQLISYHYALLIAICSSPLVLLLVFLVWIVYAIKCYLFVKQKLALPTFKFATDLTKLNIAPQHQIWLKVGAFMLMPILCHATLILYISIRHQYLFTFFVTITGLSGIFAVFSFLIVKTSTYNFSPGKTWLNAGLIKTKKPFWSWPLFYLFNEQPLMLFACKLVSLLAFKSILWMFADVGDDIRVFLTAMMAVVLSHAVLLVNWAKFDATFLSFARSLNFTTLKRLTYWLLVLFILLIPELSLLSWLTHFYVLRVGVATIFCLSTLFSLFVLVYLLKADMDRYMKYLLFFFFGTMLTILAGYYVIFSIGLGLIAVMVFIRYYPKLDLKELA
ncbi:hypothetical protein WG904_15465 [Pedobacter sp. Du54]|uniref:hypothetical protein n=1 Tax=Pedobacter anseongensis TaxID=3133439 RepID=UPI0030A749E1